MFLDKVKITIKRHRLIRKGDKVLVAVSGGPDSLALLYILNALKRDLKIKLHIAHLDHMLRRESFKDREFVEGLAKRLNLPITSAQIDVKGLLNAGGSTEEIARNTRLSFLFRVAKEVKATKIALGHNLDDQAETVLMRILRGTGLSGLSAILPKREISGFQIIRPLIEIRRKEIEAYLKRKNILPCRDVSNLEDIYFRNKIRNRLLPLLEKDYNKNIKEILSNIADSAGCDYDYLKKIAERKIKGQGKRINLIGFLKLHPAMRRLILRLNIVRLKGDTRRITFQHIREIEDTLLNRPVNSIVDLPQGISVIKTKSFLSFFRRLVA